MPNYHTPFRCTVQCPECGADHTVTSMDPDYETSRCQGATPDLCLTEMCEACLTKCDWCQLPVCSEHLTKHLTDTICLNCLRELEEQISSGEAA